MTKHTFSMAETTPASEYMFKGGQAEMAAEVRAEFILMTRYQADLPKYVIKAAAEAGYEAFRIGGTTYKNTVWGFAPFTARIVRAAEWTEKANIADAELAALPSVDLTVTGKYHFINVNSAYQAVLEGRGQSDDFDILKRATGMDDMTEAAKLCERALNLRSTASNARAWAKSINPQAA